MLFNFVNYNYRNVVLIFGHINCLLYLITKYSKNNLSTVNAKIHTFLTKKCIFS